MKVYKVRWTPEVKRTLILFLVTIFAAGLVIGLIIGKLVFQVEAIDRLPTEVTEETFESTPVETTVPTIPPKTTDPTVVTTDPPVVETENVPMGLVIAMIDKESTFRASVVSATDDYGLMQINVINHEWLSEQYGITDFLDPYQNVFCGIKILSGHLENYDGDLSRALMAYNMGAGGARRLWNQGIYSTSYTTYILNAMSVYDSSMIAD